MKKKTKIKTIIEKNCLKIYFEKKAKKKDQRQNR